MRTPLFALAIVLSSLSASSAEVDQATLDRILSELEALKQKVAALEARLEGVQKPAPAAPRKDADAGKWYEDLRLELRKADARADGPWTSPDSWTKIALKMKAEEVVAILGEPTQKKFSLRKDTDEIYYYEGDLKGNGELVRGEVRIHKGRVRRFLAPEW